MKSVAFILSVFFAFLIIMPCNDGESHSYDDFRTENKHQKDEKQNHSDFCSVFCTCSCCGIVMSVDKIAYPKLDYSEIKHTSKIPDFQNFSIPKLPAGIWQPPRI